MKTTDTYRRMAAAVSHALGAGLIFALSSSAALAQEKIERVEITGSSISRVAAEGALPVTTLTTEDIKRSGATSVTDLIQLLPSMQNFVPAPSSVNGGGGGVTTAALHSLPSKYTLVLLDGQRLAPLLLGAIQGGGYAANLASIPLDAVERVEILTDGASAIYGSDAIAGVINFILKKNKTDGEAFVNYTAPQKSGGGGWNAGASKGFGDLNTDRHNVLLSVSHDNQDKLLASQRSVSERGAYFPFSANGTNYILNNRTSNTEPANLTFTAVPAGSPAGTAATAYALNPYYTKNGNCGSPLAGAITDPVALGATGVSCRFNYAATVEDIPASKRDSALLKGTFKINEDTTLWGGLTLSSNTLTAQFAASAQPLGVNPTTRFPTLWNTYAQPYLTANNLTATYQTGVDPVTGLPIIHNASGTLGYRSVSLGGRTDDYKTDARHLSFGVDGDAMDWKYRASLTLSRSELTDTAAGGYSDFNMLNAAVASGAYDPVMGTGAGSIASAVLHSQFSKTVSDLNTLHLGGQHDLFKMAGGTSILALGGEYSTTHYTTGYSDLLLANSGYSTQPVSTDTAVGGNSGQIPFDAQRNNWGLFGEMLFPVTKTLEVTASLRYDSYAKTHSNYVFNTIANPVSTLQDQIANADLGNTFKATTGKLSFRFVPVESLLLRGSYGTGFKAPNLSDIAGALAFGGSTSNSYSCPFPGTAGCLPGSAQYDLLAGPNGLSGSAGLDPEKSKQWTLGFRAEPIRSLSFGADLWDVKITKQVLSQGIAEQVGFANPQQYAALFVNPYQDPVGGFTTIAFSQLPFNGGEAEYQGIDWDVSYRTQVALGNLAARWTGTYMLKQQYNFGAGLPFNTDLGVYGPDQQVVFRTVMNFALSLQTGAYINTLTAHYKSGYRDQAYTANTSVFLANPDGSLGQSVAFGGLDVPAFTTFDWQLRYSYSKVIQLTAGIRNLFDKAPPLSLQTGGGGNAVGYDGRYYDPTGRAFYLGGSYRF